MENNRAVVEQSFYSVLPGDEDVSLQPGDFNYWKRPVHKDSLLPHWKDLYQVLLTNPCATKLPELDSWIHVSHLKKDPKPEWTCSPTQD